MIRLIVTVAMVAAFAAPAVANDAADHCRAFAHAISSIETPADLEGAKGATRKAVAICDPDA